MSITAAAHNGIGPKTALRIWGEVVLREGYGRILPESFGWPNMSTEGRLKKYGAGAKEATVAVDEEGLPAMNRTEEAVNSLKSEQAIAHWVQGVLQTAPPKLFLFAHLYYVRGKCWEDIARQMSETEPTAESEVEGMHLAAMTLVRQAIGTRAERLAA